MWILQLLVIILTIKKFGKKVHMNQNLKGRANSKILCYIIISLLLQATELFDQDKVNVNFQQFIKEVIS